VIFVRWCAFTDYFDFDTDIYPSCLASAVCRETWSKEFFQRLEAFVSAYNSCWWDYTRLSPHWHTLEFSCMLVCCGQINCC